jgi:hypothetical protein
LRPTSNARTIKKCPIATTALETAAQSQVLGAVARDTFRRWELEIKCGLFRLGLTAGDADMVANLLGLCQLEGALARTYPTLDRRAGGEDVCALGQSSRLSRRAKR